jgi:hypothetical protein
LIDRRKIEAELFIKDGEIRWIKLLIISR